MAHTLHCARSMRTLADIAWDTWSPTDRAVLLFVIRGGEVLLIRKKRGLGAGKINAPGGRIEPGETPEEAAIRETQEELRVTPSAPRLRGHLRFQFVDGYALACDVLSSDGCEGEAQETDEAVPRWTPLHSIPYDEMWTDDRMWLPLMLAGRRFDGRFVFDGDAMLDHHLVDEDPAEALFEALRALEATFEVHAHPPVFTVDEAKRHRPAASEGVHLKNLFLRDKKGAMFLVTTHEDRAVDLRALGAALGKKNLSFASFDRLRTHLAVEPGSVTPLAVMNDRAGAVSLVLDASLLSASRIHCHPLTNDRTLSLSPVDLLRFVRASGHEPHMVDFDAPQAGSSRGARA